jgi:hypothetical protein
MTVLYEASEMLLEIISQGELHQVQNELVLGGA